VIDYRAERFEERVQKLDAVFDTVGGNTLRRSRSVLKPGGRLVKVAASVADAQDERTREAFFTWQLVCAWLLRVGLAAAFLSAVADRFGLWGHPGSRGVSWGDMAHFYDYTAEVNAFLPSTLIPAVAWLATIAETGFGFALLSGVCRRPVTLATGVLLTLFALAMSISFGVKSCLDYSVPTAAAAALLLATTDRPRCRASCGPTTHRCPVQ
jgi:uncharacterized membrane protein YphA (DoxX/SURF4 family)